MSFLRGVTVRDEYGGGRGDSRRGTEGEEGEVGLVLPASVAASVLAAVVKALHLRPRGNAVRRNAATRCIWHCRLQYIAWMYKLRLAALFPAAGRC